MTHDRDPYDVIILGSGLGGLMCGYILAREGMQVCILEKNRKIGGCLQSFRKGGQVFDTGVHYFGSMDPGQTLHRYWKYFGLTDAVKMERMDPDGFDRIIMGTEEYPMAMGSGNFIDRLLPFFPGKKEALQKYINALGEIAAAFPMYNLGVPNGRHEMHYQSKSAMEFYKNLDAPGPGDSSEGGSISRLAAVLTGNSFLYGGLLNLTPLHIPGLINHSFISSAWRPTGGSDQVATCLSGKIKESGGDILTETEALRIGMTGNAFNVETHAGMFTSKFLISGIPPGKTYEILDPLLVRKSTLARLKSLAYTLSAFTIYLVLKENTIEHMNYNCYLHGDPKDEGTQEWPANCLLYTSPGNDRRFAGSIVIMTAMDFEETRRWEDSVTGNRGGEYEEFKKKKAEKLLELAEMKVPALRSAITMSEVSTPLTWRDYTGTPGGSMYGIRREYNRPLETAVLPRTKIPNLFFTGQNTNLHGVLGVTIGAVRTCGEIVGLEMLMKKIRNEE